VSLLPSFAPRRLFGGVTGGALSLPDSTRRILESVYKNKSHESFITGKNDGQPKYVGVSACTFDAQSVQVRTYLERNCYRDNLCRLRVITEVIFSAKNIQISVLAAYI